jgi:hypothetical protein
MLGDKMAVRHCLLHAKESWLLRSPGKNPLLIFSDVQPTIVPGDWQSRHKKGVTFANCAHDAAVEAGFFRVSCFEEAKTATLEALGAHAISERRTAFAKSVVRSFDVWAPNPDELHKKLVGAGAVMTPLHNVVTARNKTLGCTVRIRGCYGDDWKRMAIPILKNIALECGVWLKDSCIRFHANSKEELKKMMTAIPQLEGIDPTKVVVIPDVKERRQWSSQVTEVDRRKKEQPQPELYAIRTMTMAPDPKVFFASVANLLGATLIVNASVSFSCHPITWPAGGPPPNLQEILADLPNVVVELLGNF